MGLRFAPANFTDSYAAIGMACHAVAPGEGWSLIGAQRESNTIELTTPLQ
jgi:hypothetical protein